MNICSVCYFVMQQRISQKKTIKHIHPQSHPFISPEGKQNIQLADIIRKKEKNECMSFVW